MKKLKAIVLSLALVTTLIQSSPSKAAVGALFAPGLVVVGLVMTVGGAAATPLIMACASHGGCGSKKNRILGTIGFAGIISAVTGVIVLEDKQSLEFVSIDETEALSKGITLSEMNSYNSEVDQINALSSYVDAELSMVKNPSKEDSASLWQSVSGELSPETLSALQKLL